MKHTHTIALEYAQAMQQQLEAEADFSQALESLGSGNQTFSLCEQLREAYSLLVKQSIGDCLFDWLEYWMYQTEFGNRRAEIYIDGKRYPVQGLQELLQLVDPEYPTPN